MGNSFTISDHLREALVATGVLSAEDTRLSSEELATKLASVPRADLRTALDRYVPAHEREVETFMQWVGQNNDGNASWRFSNLGPTIRAAVAQEPTHPDVATALDQIVSGRQVKVYGFGERHVHRPRAGVSTSLEVFARDIMTWLVQSGGVQVFGFEHFRKEQTEFINKCINNWYSEEVVDYLDRCSPGLTAVVRQVRSLREQGYNVRVRGIGPSPLQDLIRTRHAEYDKELKSNAVELFGLSPTGAVALYTGSAHALVERNSWLNRLIDYVWLGVTDARLLPVLRSAGLKNAEYVEVQLVVPEYKFPLPGLMDLYYAGLRAPLSGVALRQRGPYSHTLTMARTPHGGEKVPGAETPSPVDTTRGNRGTPSMAILLAGLSYYGPNMEDHQPVTLHDDNPVSALEIPVDQAEADQVETEQAEATLENEDDGLTSGLLSQHSSWGIGNPSSPWTAVSPAIGLAGSLLARAVIR